MTDKDGPTRIVIMGAAGRDFHNFNCVYRDATQSRVVAFTAAQIPGISGRRYPAELAGANYPIVTWRRASSSENRWCVPVIATPRPHGPVYGSARARQLTGQRVRQFVRAANWFFMLKTVPRTSETLSEY